MSMSPQVQQQAQSYWEYQQQHFGAHVSSPNFQPISPHSVEPSSSDMSSPPKTDSPYSGNLEICEDEDFEEEVEADLVEALQSTSQSSNQPFSQEFWELQAQQDDS